MATKVRGAHTHCASAVRAVVVLMTSAIVVLFGLVPAATATGTDYWVFDKLAETLTDGNWTIKAKQVDSGNHLLDVGTSAGADAVQNAYVSGDGLLDLSKPIYEGASGGTEWFGRNILAGAFSQCSHVTGIKIGGHKWQLIAGKAFYHCPNVTSLEVDSDTLGKLEYYAFGGIGGETCRTTVGKFRAPNLAVVDYASIGAIYHPADGATAERLYLPRMTQIGGVGLAGVYITDALGWNCPLRFPFVTDVGYSSVQDNKHAGIIEFGRGTLKNVGYSAFDRSSLDSIIFGHGENELNLATNLFSYTMVKSIYFNGRRPLFPAGDVKWWKSRDSFEARCVRMVIPRDDETWEDLIAEAQKAENQPTSSELAAYRNRYPNCQDPIGKIPGSFFGIENEQWLSYGCSDAKLRDLYIASTVSVAVPGTSPAANVWPTADKWFEALDVQAVSAPADWTLAEDGFYYRAIGYVYERATDEGWQVVSTNYETSAEITFETLGAQRVTWIYEQGFGGSSARPSDTLPTGDIVKVGKGETHLYGGTAWAPRSLRVDAGTLAFNGLQTTNHFFRFVFKKMTGGSDFWLAEVRFRDKDGESTSLTGYADAAAGCAPADMAAKSVWCSRQDWVVNTEAGANFAGSPKYILDGGTWSNLRFAGLKLSPDDPDTWVTIVIRLPSTAGTTAGYCLNCGYHESPADWTLETSPDGINWTLVDVRSGQPPLYNAKWMNVDDWPINSGDLPDGAGIVPTTPVQVKAGAILDGSGVGEAGQMLAVLVVDYAENGVGTLKGVRLAPIGTLDVVGVPEKMRLNGFEVPLSFVDGSFPSDFDGWTVRVNGQPSKYGVLGDNGKLTLRGPGMILLLR